MADTIEVRGPYFDELEIGQVFTDAPGVTLTSGLAAAHQAILGDRMQLPLSEPLARQVTGSGPLAHPALVCDVAIGQSTVATQHVRANLFYRGLVLRRHPVVGDTLSTVTTVEALKQNRPREGARPTGLVVLRMRTTDQQDRAVLDFWRCAMIPLGPGAEPTPHADDLSTVGREVTDDEFAASVAQWKPPATAQRSPAAGTRYAVRAADVVSSAPELARLTLNVAAVHHDAAAAGGRRLVYGGHTIGVALAQASRALPGLMTVLGWHSCDHLAPVHEGDRLTSTIEVERVEPVASGSVLHLRSQVTGVDELTGASSDVLDWRFVAFGA